jgi:hypothetical protein
MRARKVQEVVEAPNEARVVYTHAPVLFGVLLEGDGKTWRVKIGASERELEAAGDVDPELLREVAERRGRVLVDAGRPALIAGVLQTSRTIAIDRNGDVDAKVNRFQIHARDEAVLRTNDAYARVRDSDVQLAGRKLVLRAREIAKILGRMIALN